MHLTFTVYHGALLYLALVFWCSKVTTSSESHHILPVMFARFVIVFRFIFLSLCFLCIRMVARWRQSWAIFTFLNDWILLVCRRLTPKFAFILSLTRSLSISSYYFMTLGEGGEFWWFQRALTIGRRLYCLVVCLNLDVYFCYSAG